MCVCVCVFGCTSRCLCVYLFVCVLRDDGPKLTIQLCQALVAVYMSLMSHALTIYEANLPYRLVNHPFTEGLWPLLFGAGPKKVMPIQQTQPDEQNSEYPGLWARIRIIIIISSIHNSIWWEQDCFHVHEKCSRSLHFVLEVIKHLHSVASTGRLQNRCILVQALLPVFHGMYWFIVTMLQIQISLTEEQYEVPLLAEQQNSSLSLDISLMCSGDHITKHFCGLAEMLSERVPAFCKHPR